MTEQSSASSVDPKYNDNNNYTYIDEDYVDSVDNNSITSSSSHSDSSTTTDNERFSPQPKRQKTLRKCSGRPQLRGHLQVRGGIFGLDRGKPGNDHGRGSGQVGHRGGQVAKCGARGGRQAHHAGHGACCSGCGGRAHGHVQVRLLAGPANPPELWVWENVEAEYVDEINESDCFPFAETEGL